MLWRVLFRSLQECYLCHISLFPQLQQHNSTMGRYPAAHRKLKHYSSYKCLCSHSSENTTQPWVDTQQLIVSSYTTHLTVPTAPKTQTQPWVERNNIPNSSSRAGTLLLSESQFCSNVAWDVPQLKQLEMWSLSFSSVTSLHFNCYRYFDRYSSRRGGGDSVPAQSGSTAQKYQTEECLGELRKVMWQSCDRSKCKLIISIDWRYLFSPSPPLPSPPQTHTLLTHNRECLCGGIRWRPGTWHSDKKSVSTIQSCQVEFLCLRPWWNGRLEPAR